MTLLKVGLTGGIGSGKSYVARKFEQKNIPVYYADKEAKRLTYQDPDLKAKIKALLGKSAYHSNGRLNRAVVARKIFTDKGLLKKMNAIVHPAVKIDFEAWALVQTSEYVLEESAILFENKLHKNFDKTILITAEKRVRIARVVSRDKVTVEQVENRMKNQWPDKKKVSLADFVINNSSTSNKELMDQINEVHEQLIRLSKKKK